MGAKTEWLDNRLRFNFAAYYMKWNDFAVQIEDPQPVFQLGFVNLPSAKIKGIEGDFAFTLSEEWQLDGSFSRNKTATEAAAFIVNGDPTPEVPDGIYTFEVEKGARLPLTPDFSASLGLEFRSKRQLWNAEPYARFDYSYVGNSVNALEGIEAVVSSGLVATNMPTASAICGSGSKAITGAARSSSTTCGTSARSCTSATAGTRSGCRSTGRAP